jgi:hypothetical protein
MKIATKEFCEEQIHRISWKKGFPKIQTVTDFATGQERFENPGFDALVNALHGVAGDNAHAKKIIDELQQEFDTSPTPKQLRDFALTIPGPRAAPCSQCGGDGWLIGFALMVRDPVTGKSNRKRVLMPLEYERLAGQVASEGEGRQRRTVADHTPGVVGTDMLSAEFVMREAVRCKCLA